MKTTSCNTTISNIGGKNIGTIDKYGIITFGKTNPIFFIIKDQIPKYNLSINGIKYDIQIELEVITQAQKTEIEKL